VQVRQLASAWLAIGLCFLLVLVASAAGSARGVRSGSSRGWTRTGLGAVSQPVSVDGRFVLYAHRAGSLQVVALNSGDGATKWLATASASGVTAGVSPALAVRRSAVFFLEPAPGSVGLARLVGRDVSAGRILWRSSPRGFTSWPAICPDQPTAICVTGPLQTHASAELRFDAASGRQLAQTTIGTAAGGRELAPGLFDAGSRNPDVLLATNRGHVAWRRPLSAIFTLPNSSSDGGWNLDRLSRSARFVGSVAQHPRIVGPNAIVDLTQTMTAAFAISDGRVAWRHAGLYVCTILPCHGGIEAPYTSPETVAAEGPSIGLREVMTGTASIPMSGAAPKFSSGASVTLQGFDPETGKTRWAFKAGFNGGLVSGQLIPARIDVDTIVLRDRAGRLVGLNLRTGSSRPVSPSRAGWCRKVITYQLSGSAYYGGKSGQYVGQSGLYPCTGTGRRLATPANVPALVGRIGASSAGIVAWTDTVAVHAAAAG
jgi:hypothetical protein